MSEACVLCWCCLRPAMLARWGCVARTASIGLDQQRFQGMDGSKASHIAKRLHTEHSKELHEKPWEQVATLIFQIIPKHEQISRAAITSFFAGQTSTDQTIPRSFHILCLTIREAHTASI